MRAPLSWLRDYADLPADLTGRQLSDALIRVGLEVETVEVIGDVRGPVVVGRVAEIEELAEFKKPIRFCQVEVGDANGGIRGIVCGAQNFAVDDLVVVALPGAVLPGGFQISARSTYGRTSDGMICSARELDLGDEHDGIMVLPIGCAQIGQEAASLLGLGEEVLDIAVTPDRGYALSIRGIAREASIALDVPFHDHAVELADLGAPAGDRLPHESSSEDEKACDVFTLRTLIGIDPSAQTPAAMKGRLIAAGMRPVSLVVDITNYVMLETGQPLHAFDLAKLHGVLTARRAQTGEKLTTLDHVERTLDIDDLVIADDSGPLGLAGTMGGLTSEIDDSTIEIALEAAHFDDVVVARMSRRHKLSSEASRRFERGVDPTIAPYASEKAAALLVELAGATYVGMTAVEAPREPNVVQMALDLPGRVAGMDISSETVVTSLKQVGCDVEIEHAGPDLASSVIVTPPTWRPDLTDPADLVEEVIRTVGYDEVPSRLPAAPAGRGLTAEQVLRRRASKAVAALGLVETLSYPFIGDPELTRTGIEAPDPRASYVRLANPLSDEQPGMRTTLLPGLFATARRNLSRGADPIGIYEIGMVYFPADLQAVAVRPSVTSRPSDYELAAIESAVPSQPRHVAAVLAGAREAAGWWGSAKKADWSDAISLAVRLAQQLGVEVSVDPSQAAPFHPGRCAKIVADGEEIGLAGELHPRVASAWDLPARTVAFELDLDALVALAAVITTKGPQIRSMPVAKEDVALIVDASMPAADVAAALSAGAGDLLESVRLFDVYTGVQVGEGKKSLAFAMRFRAPDRTLDVSEVSAARDAAVSQASQATGAVQRGPT